MHICSPAPSYGTAGEQNLREQSRDFTMTQYIRYAHLRSLYLCYQYIFAIHTLGLLLFN